ncbi:MAG: co-chaperone GroES [Candidatus Coatesbacteria bacterium]
MKLRPLADRLVVKPLDQEEEKRGGIIIPDTAKEKPEKGEVVEVGPGKLDDNGKRVALEVKKGDRVLFGKYAGTEIKVEGQELMILREEDVLAVIE